MTDKELTARIAELNAKRADLKRERDSCMGGRYPCHHCQAKEVREEASNLSILLRKLIFVYPIMNYGEI